MRIKTIFVVFSVFSLTSLAVNFARASDLDTLKASLIVLDDDLNKVGQGVKAKAAVMPSGVLMVNIAKRFSALGRSSNFTNDLSTNLITGAKPLDTDLNAFHAGIPAVAGGANLALTALNPYKLDKPLIDLNKIINGDLADTSKTSLSSLKMRLAALGADLNDAGRYAIDPTLAKGANPFADSSSNEDLISTNISTLPFVLFISTGAQFQSPYTVSYNSSAGTAVLTNTGNTTVPYLEVSYFDRWVMRPPEDKRQSSMDQDRWVPIWDWPHEDTFWGFISRPDIEFHLGFILSSGNSATNISASSIAGGGDFWTDASVAFPLARFKSSTRNQQITLNFTGGPLRTNISCQFTHFLLQAWGINLPSGPQVSWGPAEPT